METWLAPLALAVLGAFSASRSITVPVRAFWYTETWRAYRGLASLPRPGEPTGDVAQSRQNLADPCHLLTPPQPGRAVSGAPSLAAAAGQG
jgi:hypothetical protein